ncbi:MAG: ribonuclease P [Euryarchaeota archaeon]|nr:ribonuclease P [Euryarchaeota archaeon]
MRKRIIREKGRVREVARERIQRLLDLADGAPLERADRYTALAGRLAQRHRVRLDRETRQRICKGCRGHLRYGSTARVRLTQGVRVVTCLRCGRITRIPYP